MFLVSVTTSSWFLLGYFSIFFFFFREDGGVCFICLLLLGFFWGGEDVVVSLFIFNFPLVFPVVYFTVDWKRIEIKFVLVSELLSVYICFFHVLYFSLLSVFLFL